jgi:hypothetical protein
MARLWLEYEEWLALKDAVELIPPRERSVPLRSALEGIKAVLQTTGCLDRLLDDTPNARREE